RLGILHVPAHVEPALRLVVVFFERRRMNRINRDAFARRENADDPVAGYSAAIRRKAHGQFAIDASDRDRRRALLFALLRNTEFQGACAAQPEPAAFAFRSLSAGYALAAPLGIDRAQNVIGLDLAAAHRRKQIFRG